MKQNTISLTILNTIPLFFHLKLTTGRLKCPDPVKNGRAVVLVLRLNADTNVHIRTIKRILYTTKNKFESNTLI